MTPQTVKYLTHNGWSLNMFSPGCLRSPVPPTPGDCDILQKPCHSLERGHSHRVNGHKSQSGAHCPTCTQYSCQNSFLRVWSMSLEDGTECFLFLNHSVTFIRTPLNIVIEWVVRRTLVGQWPDLIAGHETSGQKLLSATYKRLLSKNPLDFIIYMENTSR